MSSVPPWLRFADRAEAGRRLAELLRRIRLENPVVLGLARGGVPVAAVIARVLEAPLDVLIVRKIGAPGHPEFAIGAMTAGLLRMDDETVRRLGIPQFAIDEVVRAESRELARREAAYRHGRAPTEVRGRAVLIVDDGLATGQSAQVAIEAVRNAGAGSVIFAAPVCAPGPEERLPIRREELICALTPPDFYAVGEHYDDFRPTEDAEVIAHLEEAERRTHARR